MSSILAGIFGTNGPFTSSAVMAYSCTTGSVEVAASLSNSSFVEPVVLEPLRLGEGRDRLVEVLAAPPVDRAGREVRPVEQDLRLEDRRADALAALLRELRLVDGLEVEGRRFCRLRGGRRRAERRAAAASSGPSTRERMVNLSGLGAAAERSRRKARARLSVPPATGRCRSPDGARACRDGGDWRAPRPSPARARC